MLSKKDTNRRALIKSESLLDDAKTIRKAVSDEEIMFYHHDWIRMNILKLRVKLSTLKELYIGVDVDVNKAIDEANEVLQEAIELMKASGKVQRERVIIKHY